jgi:hypothetical protein
LPKVSTRGLAFASGIGEVFAHEDRAIFLDDDVELSPSFFPFCDWLLETYEDEEKVAMISGVNPLASWTAGDSTCFFSKFGNAQAWATWRRAWRLFPGARDLWSRPEIQTAISGFLADPEVFAWRDAVHGRQADPDPVWDEQWALARHARRALCAIPARNLVIHRGRGELASHVKTRGALDAIAELHEIGSPFRAPTAIIADESFDRFHFEATRNRLSPRSARWLAERLIGCGHNLLAIAVLRHAVDAADPEILALVEQAMARVRRPGMLSG